MSTSERPEDFKVDKTGWPPGPWMDEPDRVDFEHAGFPCLVLRGPGGNLCGYVGVPPGHPWHGVDFACFRECIEKPQVHGGITYSEKCAGNICHTPKPGEPDDVFWQGFDCAHHGDLRPKDATLYGGHVSAHESYKDVDYVRRETELLAEQAAAASSSDFGASGARRSRQA